MGMSSRIEQHPILPIEARQAIDFYWEGRPLTAYQGETIAAALFANGIHVFGHHHKDGSPQGIFCANGQCAQCMVLAGGKPIKSCIELVTPGLHVEPLTGLPELPLVQNPPITHTIEEILVPVLIIGGGPAGLSAAIELGKQGVEAILVDDKHRLGGKLVLQTHRFFGSQEAVYAGTRGIDIATLLEKDIQNYPSVQTWLHSTALAVFSDGKVGILKNGEKYVLVTPQVLLVASGAREKFLPFKGNTLPGVYGAGAFQTLVNRDLVRPAQRLFIVGGGNVGLIAGYHALQAGIKVVGVVEALPECGGYKVHKDKLARMGVPIYTSHTVLSANGTGGVESITIAQVDRAFKVIPGTERSFECDSVLIAVGLDPVDEFYHKAKEFGIPVFAAGDAEEIAEASAAMFSGKIKGREILRVLGFSGVEIPEDWYRTAEILKSKPGLIGIEKPIEAQSGAIPVIHCTQEIPCNPCSTACPSGLISISEDDIRQTPSFIGTEQACKACNQCLIVCPGLAITLVDYRRDPENPTVSIPFEYSEGILGENPIVTVLDTTGNALGTLPVTKLIKLPKADRTRVLQVKAPAAYAKKIAGVRIQEPETTSELDEWVEHIPDDTIVCRCERITASEIRSLVRQGYHDLNEIKVVTRAGMGACGSKTCGAMILRILREEGVAEREIVNFTKRPLFVEVPLGIFAGETNEGDGNHA